MEKQNTTSTPVVDEKIAQADRQTMRRGQLAGVLVRPVVTEKAAAANHLNQYVFIEFECLLVILNEFVFRNNAVIFVI